MAGLWRILALAFFAIAVQARSEIIAVNLTGQISNFDPRSSFLEDFQIGQIIHLSYVFETTTPQTPFSQALPNHGRYNNGHTMTVTVPTSGFTWEFGSCESCGISTFNDEDIGGGINSDQLAFDSLNPVNVTPVQNNGPVFMEFGFQYDTFAPGFPQMLTDDSVPIVPVLYDFGRLSLVYDDPFNPQVFTTIFFEPLRGTLLEADWKSIGDKAITVDTINGLEWLDISETANLTVAEVISQLGPEGEFEGFRFATPEDVAGFWSSAGLPEFSTEPNTGSAGVYSEDALRAVDLLQDYWGVSGPLPLGGVFTGAFVNDQPESPNPNLYFAARIDRDPEFYSAGTRGTSGSGAFPGFGTALVRDASNAAIANFVSGGLHWKLDSAPAKVRFYSTGTWTRKASHAGVFQCLRAADLEPIPCSGDVLPSKDDLFVDIANCPKLSVGDGSQIGSDLGEGCLIYHVVQADSIGGLMVGEIIDPSALPGIEPGLTHTYTGTGIYNAKIDSCCRVGEYDQVFSAFDHHVNNPATPYRLTAVVDIGSGNSGPVLAAPTLVTCEMEALCEFAVPAADGESNVQFRLADPTEASPDRSFTQPPGAQIEYGTGIFRWDTQGLTPAGNDEARYYSAQVIVSDGMAEGVQEFWIGLVPSDTSTPPVIGPPPSPPPIIPPGEEPPDEPAENYPPVCGTSSVFLKGGEYTFDVSASDPDPGDLVALDLAGRPPGAELSPEPPLVGNSITTTFSWIPLITGKFILNFSARSTSGQTIQCPVEIEVVDVVAPDLAVLSAGFFASNTGGCAACGPQGFWRVFHPNVTVVNHGNLKAKADLVWNLNALGVSNWSLKFKERVMLDPGEQRSIDFDDRVLGKNPGRFLHLNEEGYVLRVEIDTKNRVFEIDENNNVFELKPVLIGGD